MYIGIFWFIQYDIGWIPYNVKNEYDAESVMNAYENPSPDFEYEWSRIRRDIREDYSFDYYPRGIVDVVDGVVRIYIHPEINISCFTDKIIATFALENVRDKVQIVTDESLTFGYNFKKNGSNKSQTINFEDIKRSVLDAYKKHLARIEFSSQQFRRELFENDANDISLTELNSVASEFKCTMCGKPLNASDLINGFAYRRIMPGDSKYEDALIEIKLCINCFDQVVDYIKDHSVTSPVIAEDYGFVSPEKKKEQNQLMNQLEVPH